MSIIPKVEDLTDRIFEKLKVIERTDNDKNRKACWVCQCECGNIVIVRGSDLKRGHTTSCGCRQKSIVTTTGFNNKKYNQYDLSGEYGIGYTFSSKEFYFDLEDYDKIKDYCWSIDNQNGYVMAKDKNNRIIKMHRLVMNCMDDDLDVDHVKHKTFDNRKSELRIITRSHNCMNHNIRCDNKSGVSGVYYDRTYDKYLVTIGVNNQNIYLGCFSDFNKAVKVRKEAEEKYFEKYSYDNSMKGEVNG